MLEPGVKEHSRSDSSAWPISGQLLQQVMMSWKVVEAMGFMQTS